MLIQVVAKLCEKCVPKITQTKNQAKPPKKREFIDIRNLTKFFTIIDIVDCQW